MIKFTCTFSFLIFCLNLSIGQILSKEGFEGLNFPPSGWSIHVNIPIPGTNTWVRQTSPTTNPTTSAHSGSAVSRFRSRNVSAGTKQYLVTRAIDYTNRGSNPTKLDFWMYRDSLLINNQDSMTIWVGNADTINSNSVRLGVIARNRSIALPDTQSINAWYNFSYSIPDSFQGKSTRFIFQGTSQTININQGANMFIDDLQFEEFPPLCTDTPKVGIIINNNPVICNNGGPASLSLSSPINGFAGITYTWEMSSTTSGPWSMVGVNSGTLTIPSITKTTYYRCNVLCSYSNLIYITPIDSIVILSRSNPTVISTPSISSFCAGSGGVQLIASGALTYSWSPATGINDTTKDTVIASPQNSTQYIITGIDSFGCKDTSQVFVIVNNLPNTNISANPNDTVCFGSIVQLNALQAGGGNNQYLWSNGVTSRIDTILVTQDTTLSVVVTNGNGCSRADTISIVSLPISKADFSHTNTVNTFSFTDKSILPTSWNWDFGDGKSSMDQNPTHTYDTPGIYKVTLIITGQFCGNDTISKLVMSGPICTGIPNVGIIVKDKSSTCENSNAMLQLSNPIVGLSGLTYEWQVSDLPNGPWIPIGQNSINLTINKISVTSYFRCITSCGFSNETYLTPTDSIIVLPNPNVLVNPSSASFCRGSSGLEIIASGADSYSWSPSNGLSSITNDTIIANPDSSTLYIVTGTGINECIDTARVNITINNLPATNITATPNDTICKGNQVILAALPQGGQGNIYVWSNGKTSRRDTIIIQSDSTLFVNVTNNAGCMKADTFTVISLIAKFDCNSDKSTFNFFDKSLHGTTWHWDFGDGGNSNLQNPIHIYESLGAFTVKLIVSNEICSDTISKSIQVNILSLKTFQKNGNFVFAPNPVSNQLSIQASEQGISSVSIFDQVGKKLSSFYNKNLSKIITIPTSELNPGIYFAELTLDKNKYIFKFIKL